MPSAEEFATEWTSFWRGALPMAESFVRTANLSHVRFMTPLLATSSPDRHALISEAAFAEVRAARSAETTVSEQSVVEAREHLAMIVNKQVSAIGTLTMSERAEAKQLTDRILRFISLRQSGEVLLDPIFPGCGFIEQSLGDLLLGDELVEIKAVARPFRLSDLRQVLTYAALNHAAGAFAIGRVTLMNPRQGTYVTWPSDLLCYGVAGLAASEVYEAVIRFASEYEAYPG